MDQLREKMSNYFFKVIWTFNLAACIPSSSVWEFPLLCVLANNVIMQTRFLSALTFFVVFFCFCYYLLWNGRILGDHLCHLWARDVSNSVAFNNLIVLQWMFPWCSKSYCQNLNAFYSLSSWKIIQKLLGINSLCKGQLQFYI